MLATIKSRTKNHAQLLAQSLEQSLNFLSLGRTVGVSLGIVSAVLAGGIQPAQAEGHMHGQAIPVSAQRQSLQGTHHLEKKAKQPSTMPSTMLSKVSTYRPETGLSLERSRTHQSIQPLLAQGAASQEVAATDSELPNDGVYLYGQQPLPDQLATAYLVFEARAGVILGAFYMPHSSFDCVQGQFQETQLALTITDSYAQDTFEYAVGLERDAQVASLEGAAAIALEGYHRIQQVTDNDLRMIETCKTFYSEEI